MGSFNATCAVSGLPVEYDDEVRLIMLAKAPRFGRRGGDPAAILVHAHDSWTPISCPMKGKYADYGNVELDDPKDPMTKDFQVMLASSLARVEDGITPDHEPPADQMDMFDFSKVQDLCKKNRIFAMPAPALRGRIAPVPVGYMMVHENVFQSMVEGYYNWDNEFRHLQDIARESPAIIDRFIEDRDAGTSARGGYGPLTPILCDVDGAFSPSGVNIGMHLYPDLLLSAWNDRRTSEEDKQSKLRSIIEASLFDGSMNALGRHYAPQTSGGQDVEWWLHEKIAQVTLAHIRDRSPEPDDVDMPAP